MRANTIARIGAVNRDNKVNCQQSTIAAVMQATALSGYWMILPPISRNPFAITFMSLVKCDMSLGVPLSETDW